MAAPRPYISTLPFPSKPSPPIVLAPGNHITRLGLSGSPVPNSLFPSSHLSLSTPATFASSLALLLASKIALPSAALPTRTLIILEPVTNYPRTARDAIIAGARLLKLPCVVFLPTPTAVKAIALPDAYLPWILLDVGWSGARVVYEGVVVEASARGVKDVDAALKAGGVVAEDMCTLRVAACHFEGGGNLVSEGGRVVVEAELRVSASRVLFQGWGGDDDGVGGAVARAIAGVLKRDFDAGAAVAQRIVCIGGGACIGGFGKELVKDVGTRLGEMGWKRLGGEVRVLKTGSWSPDVAGWVGASLLGCTGMSGGKVEVLEGRQSE